MITSVMNKVNSLSGGKTSSYLHINYPADFEVFALVCINDHNAGRDLDKKLVQMANDRLQKHCSHWPEFVATSEDPIILRTMFDLEQLSGREITWLRGMAWEDMLRYKKAIPNMNKRFCTTIMKMQPIFEFLYMHTELPVAMRVGYRWDEMERAERFTETWKYASHCEYQEKSNRWIHRWVELAWRIGEFPLIDDQITHAHVRDFWQGKSIQFPEDSNCQNCFWKDPQQLRKNFDTNAPIMFWSAVQEAMYDRTFNDKNSLLEIANMGIQLDFMFGTGSGCKAGFCTD